MGINSIGPKGTTSMAESISVNNWINKAMDKPMPDIKFSIFDKK
jgi:hypothetical protein